MARTWCMDHLKVSHTYHVFFQLFVLNKAIDCCELCKKVMKVIRISNITNQKWRRTQLLASHQPNLCLALALLLDLHQLMKSWNDKCCCWTISIWFICIWDAHSHAKSHLMKTTSISSIYISISASSLI